MDSAVYSSVYGSVDTSLHSTLCRIDSTVWGEVCGEVCSALLGGQLYNGWTDTQSLPNITAALCNTTHDCIKKIMYVYI